IPHTTVLSGGEYLVLGSDRNAFLATHSAHARVIGNLGFGLSADGETLRLLDPAGTVADSITYRPLPPWPDLSALDGHTIELKHPMLDNALPSSWAPSIVVGGTPGEANS